MKAKVLVILPSDKFLHRQILEGILSYGHENGPWQFHFETGSRYEQGLAKLRNWGCTGVVALVRERPQMQRILRTKTPAVLINPPTPPKGTPEKPPKWATFVNRVQEDVGKSAAEYFLERGFRNFAFVGTPKPAEWCREAVHLAKWLRSLEPETALYAPWDRRALQIISLCSEIGISVPVTVAVLGTDNDEILCESSTPSLSSIALDGQNAGRLCARLLDMHMRGRRVEPMVDLAFPRIVTRQSTDRTLVPDPFLAQALAMVRKDLSVVRTIEDIASELHISRRSLEMKANLVLGSTLKSEINRIRLNEAVRLISNTDLPMSEIAEKCGFCCASHLNTRFKAAFGHSPSVFRYRDPS